MSYIGLKLLARSASYSTIPFMQNSEATSRGVLSDPSLVGSTFAQVKEQNSTQRPRKKRQHVSQIRNTPQNVRGSKTSVEKRGTAFHKSETHPKNVRGSKTSDEKRGTMFHESEKHLKIQEAQRPLMKKRHSVL
jgi:hypothetical protein